MYDDGIQQIVHEAPCVSDESFFSVERLATNTDSVDARVLSQGFIQIDRCSRSSHCFIFIEKWMGLAAFVNSDEFHHVDVTTTSNNVCHSQKSRNVKTYPRTSRLVLDFFSLPTCLCKTFSVEQRMCFFDYLLSIQTCL